MQYQRLTGVKLFENELGLFISDYAPASPDGSPMPRRYGATPDRITVCGILIEIKCPFRREITPVVPKHYIGQVQFQMLVTETTMAHFVQYKPPDTWSPGKLEITLIPYDPVWWETSRPVLNTFWDKVLAFYGEHGKVLGSIMYDEAKLREKAAERERKRVTKLINNYILHDCT